MGILDRHLGGNLNRKQTRYMWYIIALIALGFEGFRFYYWKNSYSILYYIALCFIIINVFLTVKSFRIGNFSNYVLLLALLPFVSLINTAAAGESIVAGAIQTFKISALWFTYYLLHIYRVKEATILRMMLYVSLVIAAIEIIQQFTYPNYWFGGLTQEKITKGWGTEEVQVRNGIYRFRSHINMYFSMPFILLVLEWIIEKYNAKLLVLFILLSAAVYLTLTRQIIFSFLLVFAYSFFIKKQNKIANIFILFFAIFAVIISFNTLFGNFSTQTMEEATDENIRLLSANFFWNDSIKSGSIFMLGNGHLAEFEKTLSELGYYYTDVGFIGAIWKNGFMFVFINYYLLYCLFYKYKNTIPSYIRLFVVYVTIMSIMIYPFTATIMTFIWPLLLYICDLHIDKSPLALRRI